MIFYFSLPDLFMARKPGEEPPQGGLEITKDEYLAAISSTNSTFEIVDGSLVISPRHPNSDEALAAARANMKLTKLQMIRGLVSDQFITSQDGINWAKGVSLPAFLESGLSELPQAEADSVRMTALLMTEVDRSHFLISSIAALSGADDAQVDEFFIRHRN